MCELTTIVLANCPKFCPFEEKGGAGENANQQLKKIFGTFRKGV